MLGSLLCGVAALFECVGLYQLGHAVKRMSFQSMDDELAIKDALVQVTSGLAEAGNTLGLVNLVLLVGGGFVTYALQVGGFRERWFFWSTLTYSLVFVWQPLAGTVFGIWWLCLLISKRSQFFVKQGILIPG